MKILQIKEVNGQFKYRVLRDGEEIVSFQWGAFSREETIEQAFSRFGHCDRVENI